jgi:hypothetical protein
METDKARKRLHVALGRRFLNLKNIKSDAEGLLLQQVQAYAEGFFVFVKRALFARPSRNESPVVMCSDMP